ncbi:hypothetical protein YC2023_086947 [Brassica napus]
MRKMKGDFLTLALISLLLAISFVHGGGESVTPAHSAVSQNSPTGGSSGASGSAHGPNWEYDWGWGSTPEGGYGYGSGSGSGSGSTPDGGKGTGFGFGSGSGTEVGFVSGGGGATGGSSGHGSGTGQANEGGGSGGGNGAASPGRRERSQHQQHMVDSKPLVFVYSVAKGQSNTKLLTPI